MSMQSSELPEENQRPVPGRKLRKVQLWARYPHAESTLMYRWWGQWSRLGRYRSEAEAEMAVKDHHNNPAFKGFEFHIGERPDG